MSVKVLIPTPLRSFTDHASSVSVEGSNVDEILKNLSERYGDLRNHLFGEHFVKMHRR